MKRLAILACLTLVLTGPVQAAGAKKNIELALFQPKTIFHSGLTHAHTVALTFDDGPNPRTGEVLDTLKALNVKATFFIVGKMAHRYPAILARIAAEGHLLANHSGSHALLTSRYDSNPDMLLEELRDVDDQIQPLMRQGDKLYFRAPYGAWKSAHAEILNRDRALRNYVGPIYWDIGGDVSMSRDGYVMSAADWECWRLKWTAKTCAKGYLRELRRKDGGVVLMHSIQMRSADLVAEVVPALLEEGYNFVRLDQMPEYRQYETPRGPDLAKAPAAPRVLAAAKPSQLDRTRLVRVSEVK